MLGALGLDSDEAHLLFLGRSRTGSHFVPPAAALEDMTVEVRTGEMVAHLNAIFLSYEQLSLCLMCSLLLQAAAEQAAILSHRPQDLKTLLEQLGLEKWWLTTVPFC